MSAENPYHDLTIEQSEAVLETLRERYWNAAEYLASIAADKATIHNHIQELSAGEIT